MHMSDTYMTTEYRMALTVDVVVAVFISLEDKAGANVRK